MKPLRKIAAASNTVAALSLAQAVTASACDEQDPAASFTASARSATAKYHSLTVAKRPAIRSRPILPGSHASPNPEWVPSECTT